LNTFHRLVIYLAVYQVYSSLESKCLAHNLLRQSPQLSRFRWAITKKKLC
jgi:hypothetical protein